MDRFIHDKVDFVIHLGINSSYTFCDMYMHLSAIFMWYYSFVDFFNSYLRFVCTCMFAPTTNDQIYPDISCISPFYLHTKADVTKINILSDYIFLTRGLRFFFFICSWYTLRLSWCNIYSRIGPVHHNWHLCVLNWRCFFCLLM